MLYKIRACSSNVLRTTRMLSIARIGSRDCHARGQRRRTTCELRHTPIVHWRRGVRCPMSNMLEAWVICHLRMHHRGIWSPSVLVAAHVVSTLAILIVIVASSCLICKVLRPLVFMCAAILLSH